MDRKDTFHSWRYKNGVIHTCENRTTGKVEVRVQARMGAVAVKCNTVIGAQRAISGYQYNQQNENDKN